MLDVPGPDCALEVDEDPGHGVVELHHDQRAQEPGLVPEREEVAGEPTLGRVRHL